MASTSTVALNYGLNWLTGTKLQGRTITNSGSSATDYNRVAMYLLGEGEMDGLVELWDSANGRLYFQNEGDNPALFHFHRGCDANALGSGTGTDQGLDSFWQYLAPGIQPLYYHRWAYYAYCLKEAVDPSKGTNQNPANADLWGDVNPIGLWRGMRCRTFNATGTLTGYAFTRNPAWHYVDLLLRRKLFPEYSIDFINGADDLPGAVRARFDWAAIADSAASFAAPQTVGPNAGQPMFTGDYSLSQRTSLQANLTQILTVARAYQRERAGTFSILADKPRASVFTFNRKNADSFVPSDADVHAAANDHVASFRDLHVPAAATIVSIATPDHASPVVSTLLSHPFAVGDHIVIGNTGTRYDGNWVVGIVPDGDSVTTMTLANKGSNYPVAVGAGGLIGLRYSRFKQRQPEFQHKAHQLARGAVGVGLPRQRNKVKVETDFANSTWQQVARISAYQRAIALGPDVRPYVAPPRATLAVPLFAEDAAGSGAVAVQIEPGDVVTIDDTLSTAYAGLYEVMQDGMKLAGSSAGAGSQRTPVTGGLTLTLRPYSDANYPETAADSEPGWVDVPGLPGSNLMATVIPLADGGQLSIYRGSAANGESFQMPSGYSSRNKLCWASPQGYIETNGHLHYIEDCDAYDSRRLSLIYNDGSGNAWHGDVNYFVVAWVARTAAQTFSIGPMNYVELTLLGGEKIVFGKGFIAGGDQVPLPAGYAPSCTLPLAFPKASTEHGQPTCGFASWINPGGIAHGLYDSGNGTQWDSLSQAFIFAFANNLGSWRKHDNGWFHTILPGGKALALAVQLLADQHRQIQADVAFPIVYGQGGLAAIPPLANISSATIQMMTGPNGFDIPSSHVAHGTKQCFVDDNLNSICTFEDGEGNVWGGSAGVFSLLYDTPTQDLGGNLLPADSTTWPGTGTGSPSNPGAGTGTGGSGGGGQGGGGGTGGGGTGGGIGGGGRGSVEQ